MKCFKLIAAFSAGVILTLLLTAFTRHKQQEGYILEREKEIAVNEKGPHDGGGETIAYPFFSRANDFKLVFRKRTLKPGSSIGYHLQEKDEIYYIVSGTGEMTINGKSFTVSAGDAVLTRPGNSHGLKPTGNSELSLIINYEK
jgi:mannose-6-phosphate isomerase-like protein (cupin superfamily)